MVMIASTPVYRTLDRPGLVITIEPSQVTDFAITFLAARSQIPGKCHVIFLWQNKLNLISFLSPLQQENASFANSTGEIWILVIVSRNQFSNLLAFLFVDFSAGFVSVHIHTKSTHHYPAGVVILSRRHFFFYVSTVHFYDKPKITYLKSGR